MPGCRSWKVHQYVLTLVMLSLCMPSHQQAVQLVLSLVNKLCQMLLPHCVFEATAMIVADFSLLFSASSWLTWLVLCTRACVDRQTCLQKPRQRHPSLWVLSRYRDPPAQCQVSPSYELTARCRERHLVCGVVSCMLHRVFCPMHTAARNTYR